MPYERTTELPESVKHNLPAHAQKIYLEAFNHAWDEYRDPKARKDKKATHEETAHKVAWAAVKKVYHKEGDRWVRDDH